MLPTPRFYARFPFFNMMNSTDVFGTLAVKPTARVTARADVHALRLADAHDLWYQGGGAFQQRTLGFFGQPSNGHAGLATLYDASADVTLSHRVTAGLYYGHAAAGAVPRAIYPADRRASFGYVELVLRF